MSHRVVKIGWFRGASGSICYECKIPISTLCEFDVWWRHGGWRGRYCGECIRGVDMVYDSYLEISDTMGCVTYYDMETISRCYPGRVSKLTKI